MVLLDSSAAIQFMKGERAPQSVRRENFGLSVVVQMELMVGVFHRGGDKEKAKVSRFLEMVSIYEFDTEAAIESARIKAELWDIGKPIGDFDTQIAGHALALELPLLTGNVKHFERVNGLRVILWEDRKS